MAVYCSKCDSCNTFSAKPTDTKEPLPIEKQVVWQEKDKQDALRIIEEFKNLPQSSLSRFDAKFGMIHHRGFPQNAIKSFLLSEVKELIVKMEGLRKTTRNKKYDGNDLKSAGDAYYIAADTWSEIIRYEDGFNAAIDSSISLVREHFIGLREGE